MNPLAKGFDRSAHLAGICNCRVQKLKIAYGLDDFVTNAIQDDDDAPTIAVKALDYFCDEWDPLTEKCKIAVVARNLSERLSREEDADHPASAAQRSRVHP